MKHKAPTVEARPREKVGSIYARRLRKAGRLPAVIYGHKKTPVAISVDEDEMLMQLRRRPAWSRISSSATSATT
jgi:large subunit ribosomal protein L25